MVALIKRSPTRTLARTEPRYHYHPWSLFEDMEALTRDLWEGWREPAAMPTTFSPRIDMYEEKDELVLRAELPGVKKENLDIRLEGDCLLISAEKRAEELSKEAVCYAGERCFGSYSRSVRLPFPVDFDSISATLEDGVLDVRLPKAAEARSKHIEVKVR